jgi:hypothetical protein
MAFCVWIVGCMRRYRHVISEAGDLILGKVTIVRSCILMIVAGTVEYVKFVLDIPALCWHVNEVQISIYRFGLTCWRLLEIFVNCLFF